MGARQLDIRPSDRRRSAIAAETTTIIDATHAASHPADIIHALCRTAWIIAQEDPAPMPDELCLPQAYLQDLLPRVHEDVRDEVHSRINSTYRELNWEGPEKGAHRRCFDQDVLVNLHQAWLEKNSLPSTHPVFPVVEAAMKLNVLRADRDRRRTGIQPAFLGAHAVPGNDPLTSVELFECGFISPPGGHWIYAPPDGVGGPAPAMLLALLDRDPLVQKRHRGASAPLRDRLFCEVMMALTRTQRKGVREGVVSVHTVVRDWLQWDVSDYRPNGRYRGLAIARAMKQINAITVPMNQRGGWWKPLTVPAFEGRRLTDRIKFRIELPYDSDHGARIDRRALRLAGKVSAVAWRLYLSLCFEWNNIARGGREPRLTRPVVLRDEAGNVLGATGAVLTDRRGVIQKSPFDRRAVPTGQREPSPRGMLLHRTYESPADLVRAIWPMGNPAAKRNPRRSEEQAVTAALWLARESAPSASLVRLGGKALTEPAIRIVREGTRDRQNPHGFPWRIVRHGTL